MAKYQLIMPRRENVRNGILNWFGQDEDHLYIIANYTLLSNVVLLVEEGMGCAVCLDGALAIGSRPGLRFVLLPPEYTTRSVLLWKKSRMFSPAASLFIQMIKQGEWMDENCFQGFDSYRRRYYSFPVAVVVSWNKYTPGLSAGHS